MLISKHIASWNDFSQTDSIGYTPRRLNDIVNKKALVNYFYVPYWK